MIDIVKGALIREKELLKLIKEKKKAVENTPSQTLHISQHRGGYQYYQWAPENKKGKEYIKKQDTALIIRLAQKEYDKRVLEAAEKEEKILRRLCRFYQSGKYAEETLRYMHEGKRTYVRPVRSLNQDFVREWMSESYKGLEFRDELPAYYTENGEKVRSKSEVIIANMLKKYEIPYRYECPLELPVSADGRKNDFNRGKVYPDFTVLRVQDRRELYWEHLGLLDDSEYLRKSLGKIMRYELNGYFPGESLILTFEAVGMPLNMTLLERTIEKYCR